MTLTAALRDAIRRARDKAVRERLRLEEVDSLGRRKHGAGEHRIELRA